MLFRSEEANIGGAAIEISGRPIDPATLARAGAVDTVLLGAVGGPKWSKQPYDYRPEAGLLALRAGMGVFANLRPAVLFPALADASSLKPARIAGLDAALGVLSVIAVVALFFPRHDRESKLLADYRTADTPASTAL